MHILLLHQVFIRPGDAGGTRHYEFARHLVRAGHRVTVLTGTVSYLDGAPIQAERREIIEPGFEIIRCAQFSSVHKNFIRRTLVHISFMVTAFFRGLFIRNVDLVFGTSPPLFQAISAFLIAWFKRKPFLFEVRDLWPYFAVAMGVLRQRQLLRLAEWAEAFLYRHADLVMINSPGFEEHVRAHGAADVAIVPNGVDIAEFDPQMQNPDFRRQHQLEDKFVLLYTGAHGMANDLGVVLDAAERLLEYDDVRILFLGDGREKAHLVADAAERGLENILFLDPVAKQQIPMVLAAVDACLAVLMPIDAFKLTYPNKVFDYMAAGKPVILAIDGVIREVVERAQAGIAVAPGNADALAKAILKFARNPAMVREMGRNGRIYVQEHFNRSQQAQKAIMIMEQLAAEK